MSPVVRVQGELAAKRRENAAHGASRGRRVENLKRAPKGRKKRKP